MVETVENSAVSKLLKANKPSILQHCWMFNTASLVSQMASSSLGTRFL
ncbi:hypothetical protein ASZ84_03191 [Vibrio cholerae]|nr:hypothetical protein ASZ84_03191 [Vibrio cholerae]EAZ74649.1 hypothetical protein A5C_A0519 [Vibrio cholerae NCTC 8457]EEO21683.1 hypothetical protein VCF_001630 [Vibrio cholerae BX 330286]EMQ60654.1 hypothetical protein VCEM1676A_003018 [Vibrio cholerae O1 str. EM-1676A]BAP04710.1 hypothetical protein MS6_A0451 [Vibrio cholerae MS6]